MATEIEGIPTYLVYESRQILHNQNIKLHDKIRVDKKEVILETAKMLLDAGYPKKFIAQALSDKKHGLHSVGRTTIYRILSLEYKEYTFDKESHMRRNDDKKVMDEEGRRLAQKHGIGKSDKEMHIVYDKASDKMTYLEQKNRDLQEEIIRLNRQLEQQTIKLPYRHAKTIHKLITEKGEDMDTIYISIREGQVWEIFDHVPTLDDLS